MLKEEELKENENLFRKKYSIKSRVDKKWENAFGADLSKNRPPFYNWEGKASSWWRNSDGYLILCVESKEFKDKTEDYLQLKDWCEKWKFSFVIDKELKPFYSFEYDYITMIVFTSTIKLRSKKELKKYGIETD